MIEIFVGGVEALTYIRCCSTIDGRPLPPKEQFRICTDALFGKDGGAAVREWRLDHPFIFRMTPFSHMKLVPVYFCFADESDATLFKLTFL